MTKRGLDPMPPARRGLDSMRREWLPVLLVAAQVAIGLSWELAGGQRYYLWAAEKIEGPWRTISETVQAGTNVLRYPYVYRAGGRTMTNTNTLTLLLTNGASGRYVRPETGNVILEWEGKAAWFFKVTTDAAGARVVPVRIEAR